MSSETKTIFLTGVGRSGTTLLQSMLHAHPAICFGPETHFFKKVVVAAHVKGGKITGAEFKQMVSSNKIEKRTSYSFSINEANEYDLDQLTGIFTEILDNSCSTPDFRADKDTEYIRYIPHLASHFPESYLIQIVRDPRDVLASRKQAGWSRNRISAFHAAEYQFYMELTPPSAKELFKERYLVVRYEDLIASPEKELRSLCAQLNIEFDEAMLSYYTSNESLVADDESAWKENVFKPVIKTNVGKWKEELSSAELALVEVGFEDQMTTFGYEPTGRSRLSYLDRLMRESYRYALARKTRKESL